MGQVVVTGATGRIGAALVRNLSAHGVAVRAVSRSPARGANLPGVEWMAADLSSPETLSHVLTDVEALFLLTIASERMVEAQHNAIEAAARAGIRHVVKLSALGASAHSRSPIARWHYAGEQELIGSGLNWTILRPHYFMDNLLEQADTVRSGNRISSPVGPGRVPFIDTRDIADVAAVLLTRSLPPGRKYPLTGAEALDYTGLAALMSQVLGRHISYLEESIEQARSRLQAQGRPAWEVDSALALWAYQRAGGPTAAISPDVSEVLGREPRSMLAFLRDHASAFAAAAGPARTGVVSPTEIP